MNAAVVKQLILVTTLVHLVSCGKAPTSQLNEQLPIIRSGPLDMDFSFIPGGYFRMGSESSIPIAPRHWVRLTEDYSVQTKEVTRGQWYEIMGEYPEEKCFDLLYRYIVKENDHPAVCVIWKEAKQFIALLNDREKGSGYTYRLPTEAEWEFATRAYTEDLYSIDAPLESFAWYSKNSNNHTHPVGELKANFFGLYDVHGNISEWTSDRLENYPEADLISQAAVNPTSKRNDGFPVNRGGSFHSGPGDIRSDARLFIEEDSHRATIGLRLVRTKD